MQNPDDVPTRSGTTSCRGWLCRRPIPGRRSCTLVSFQRLADHLRLEFTAHSLNPPGVLVVFGELRQLTGINRRIQAPQPNSVLLKPG